MPFLALNFVLLLHVDGGIVDLFGGKRRRLEDLLLVDGGIAHRRVRGCGGLRDSMLLLRTSTRLADGSEGFCTRLAHSEQEQQTMHSHDSV